MNVDTEDRGARPNRQPSSPTDKRSVTPADRSTPGTSGSGGGDDRGFKKFPSGGDRPAPQPDRPAEQPKGNIPSTSTAERGTWQRFPSGSGGRQDESARASGRDRSSDRQSKPPLELNKPIVTPRSAPETRSAPPMARTPDVRNEPRSMPEMRSEPRGGGGGYDRGVARSSGGGGYDRGGSRSAGGGGGGSRSGGGGSRGSSSGGGGSRGGGGGGGDKGGSKSAPKSR